MLRNDGTALITTTAPSTGTWHHVAYTWNGTNNNLYVDGVAVTATATAHDSAAVTAGVHRRDQRRGRLLRRFDRRGPDLRPRADRDGGELAGPGPHARDQHRHPHVLPTRTRPRSAPTSPTSSSRRGPSRGRARITIEGSWLNYGGRFTGTGTVTLTSNAAEGLLSGGSSFAALTINRGSANYTMRDRLWIPNGPFTLTDGRIQCGAYTMHVGSMALTAGHDVHRRDGDGRLRRDQQPDAAEHGPDQLQRPAARGSDRDRPGRLLEARRGSGHLRRATGRATGTRARCPRRARPGQGRFRRRRSASTTRAR